MVVPARALALQAELRELLKVVETLVRREPEFDPATGQHIFSVAASDNAVLSLGLPLIARVAAQAGPKVQLTLRNAVHDNVATALRDGTIDLLFRSKRMVSDKMTAPPVLRSVERR